MHLVLTRCYGYPICHVLKRIRHLLYRYRISHPDGFLFFTLFPFMVKEFVDATHNSWQVLTQRISASACQLCTISLHFRCVKSVKSLINHLLLSGIFSASIYEQMDDFSSALLAAAVKSQTTGMDDGQAGKID